jgi:hypothetical protein
MRARLSLLACLAGVVVAMAVPASASAQPPQQGLVNVSISGLTVQIPVSVAANICDVNVAVLVAELQDAPADCTAEGTAGADAITPAGGNGGGGPQTGLVNVSVEGTTVQVPIAVAANVCDLNVAILVGLLVDDTASCEADASSIAHSRPNNN